MTNRAEYKARTLIAAAEYEASIKNKIQCPTCGTMNGKEQRFQTASLECRGCSQIMGLGQVALDKLNAP